MSTTAAPAVLQLIPVASILPSPQQARKDFDEVKLQGLAESMKQEGQLMPVLVRKAGNRYELISGERRLRAAKRLGWKSIEAKILKTAGDAEAAAKGLVENLQRVDLNPIEEAEGFQTLNQLDPKHWTQKRIGGISGRTQAYISQSLSLVGLPEEIKKSIRALILSRSHGLQLLRLSNPERQMEVARQIPGRLTWEETRALVDGLVNKEAGSKPRKLAPRIDWEAGQGFQFKEKDRWVEVRGLWDREKDWETFLAELRGAMLLWIGQHPYQLKGNVEDSRDAVERLKDSKKNLERDNPSNFQQRPQPGAIASLRNLPKSVYHDAQDKRSLTEKIQQVTRLFSKQKNEPRLPANSREQAELEALATKGPQAVYTWIYGPDHFLTQSVAGATWEKLGCSDPTSGVRELLKGIRS